MIECERFKTNPQKMQRKTATNTLWYGECLCLRHYKHLYPWERITQKFWIPSKIQESISQWNRCSAHLGSWQTNSQMRSMEQIQISRVIVHGNIYLWLVVRFTYFVPFCKDEREPTIKLCNGNTVVVVQKFTRIQSYGHNYWWANRIRVEYFPRIHHIAACQWSPRVPGENERPSTSPRTNYLHVDVQWHLMGIRTQWTSSSFLIRREDFHQEEGHSSDLDQGRNGILLTNTIHKENGTKLRNKWWVHCHEERSRVKVVDNCQYTSVPMEIRLKLFCAQLFLVISSVFAEQSEFCVKNV